MTEDEATGAILSALFSFEDSLEDEMEIITGNGYVLTRVVEELASEQGFNFFHKNGNTGSYIIKK